MKRRVLLAVLGAIAVVVLAGAEYSISAPAGASGTRGQPWTGERGVTESVATLMARQRAEDRRRAGRPPPNRDRPEPRPLTRPKSPGSPLVQTRTGSAAVTPKSELTAGGSFLGAHR